MDTKYCLICKKPRKTVYFNMRKDKVTGQPTVSIYCCACGRSYKLEEYCVLGGITPYQLIKSGLTFNESSEKEVNRLDWPSNFISLLDDKAYKGQEYLESRGLKIEGDIYYDTRKNGIVFPMYYHLDFCGAQIRLIEPRESYDGSITKMISLTGTRSGILVYNWNQMAIPAEVSVVVITEGAINCLSLMQACTETYRGKILNPFKFVSLCGSGATKHHVEIFKDLKNKGYRVVLAADSDEAGVKMFDKFTKNEAITHCSTTNPNDGDWNDILIEKGPLGLFKYFLKGVKKV